MTSTQTMVEKAIDAKVAERGYKVVRDREWGNTGTIHAVTGLSLTPVGERFSFYFEDGGVTFSRPNQRWTHGSRFSYRPGQGSLDEVVEGVVNAIAPEQEPDFCARCMQLDAECQCYAVANRPGILTVGELKRRLEGVEDHVHVCVTGADEADVIIDNGWWNNVADTVAPMGDEQGHYTFDLVVGDAFDTRQF